MIQCELEGVYRGASVFLVCPGPSLLEDPWQLVAASASGPVFGINDVPLVVDCDFWTTGDTPKKWPMEMFDTRTIKFIPTAWRREIDQKTWPGVVFFERNSDMRPAVWLDEPTVNWGCGSSCGKARGLPPVQSTLIQALKLCWLIGFRNVYLLGVDFAMGSEQPYATGREAGYDELLMANVSMQATERLISLLLPTWKDRGFRVVRCTGESLLDCIPHVCFDEAIANMKKERDESYV